MGVSASGTCSQLRAGCPEPIGAPLANLVPNVWSEEAPEQSLGSSTPSWRPPAPNHDSACSKDTICSQQDEATCKVQDSGRKIRYRRIIGTTEKVIEEKIYGRFVQASCDA